jgi:hypothetical protein
MHVSFLFFITKTNYSNNLILKTLYLDVCSYGANLPGTTNGCYDVSGYICQCATGII